MLFRSFVYTPVGTCLNTAGLVSFDATGISAAGSTITNYAWTFGNSLTNNGANATPSSNYNEGTYTISLTTTAANGCSFDTSLTTTFNKTPDLGPLAPITVCENGTPVNLTTPTVLNAVAGSGVFSSFKGAASATGLYTPSTAGYGTDTIYYTFTSNGGCVSVVKTAIYVNARPYGTFSFSPTSGCLNRSEEHNV